MNWNPEPQARQKVPASKLDRDLVIKALSETGFVISHAAKVLNISRPSLYLLINKYEIDFQKCRRACL